MGKDAAELWLPGAQPETCLAALCSSSRSLIHPRPLVVSFAATQARLRNSDKVIGASGSSGPSSAVASHGASCFRYFALSGAAQDDKNVTAKAIKKLHQTGFNAASGTSV